MSAQLAAPRVRLDDRAVVCNSRDDFLKGHRGSCQFELNPEGWQKLSPSVWKGRGDRQAYDSRTRRQSSVRIYSFNDNPMVLGKTAIINGGEFLELPYLQFCETSRFHEFGNVALVEDFGDELVKFKLPSNHLHVRGDCAPITQKGDEVWGHWLVDVLPRIRLIRKLLPEITIALAEGPRWTSDLLRHAGIDPGNVVRYRPYETVLTADRVFLPSFVRFANGFSPLASDAFASLARAEEHPKRKFYITRSGAPGASSIINNVELEALFVRAGFEVVSPERLKVQEQITLFAQANQIAGEYGSGMHNSIFAAPGTRVVSLQSESVSQFVQAGIGGALRQPTGFVFGETRSAAWEGRSGAPSRRDRLCWIDPALAKQALEEFLQP